MEKKKKLQLYISAAKLSNQAGKGAPGERRVVCRAGPRREKGETINHFLILHEEVGWRGGQGQTGAEQGLRSSAWAGFLGVCRLREGDQSSDGGGKSAATRCPSTASPPGAAHRNRWCQAALEQPRFPGRGAPAPLQPPGCRSREQ